MSPNQQTLAQRLDWLLEDVCVDFGFCVSLKSAVLLREDKQLTAQDFADAVLIAEGMTPEYEKHWRNALADAFRKRFGAEAVQDGNPR